MKNPLFKRLKREFIRDLPKYIVIFLFLMLPIALCSGYMIGNDSMIKTYYESIDKYNLEDGHFQTMFALSGEQINQIENSQNIIIQPLCYKEETSTLNHTIRVYKSSDRTQMNKVCIHKGKLPLNADEIALDRLYSENNKINIGDKITIGGKSFTITGLVSLFDYSCGFKDNTDSMFNATSFSIALVSDSGFEYIDNFNLKYNYAYTINDNLEENELHDKNNEIRKNIFTFCMTNSNNINDFIERENNQSIQFSINDIEGDLTMMLIFGILIIGGLAFVFALSIKSQIEQESGSIGTLKALGYKNGEILIHFLILPLMTVICAGIVGNIFSYTLLKDYIVTLYYHSYSLPVYTTYFNLDALIYTTIIPILLVIMINILVLYKSIKLHVLNLLSGTLKTQKDKKVAKIDKKIPFMHRFRLRVIFQNKGTYFALFMGTLFACVILLFGLMMNPLLTHYKESVLNSQLAPIQTILKADIPVDDENAEKILYTSLTYFNDDIMIYGVEKSGNNSVFLKNLNFENDKVVINSSLFEKYKLKENSQIVMTKKYSEDKYTFNVSSVFKNDGNLIVFMDIDYFKSVFDENEYLVSYLSNEKLGINDGYVYKVITLEDLTNVSTQLVDSMGDLFIMFTIFSAILFGLLIYLLAKIVIEKNQKQISMMKIMGYSTREINRAYNIPTGIMVLFSVVVCTILSKSIIKMLWDYFLRVKLKGWVSFYIAPHLYPEIILISAICYLVVYFIESRKINKIALSYTLKEGNI